MIRCQPPDCKYCDACSWAGGAAGPAAVFRGSSIWLDNIRQELLCAGVSTTADHWRSPDSFWRPAQRAATSRVQACACDLEIHSRFLRHYCGWCASQLIAWLLTQCHTFGLCGACGVLDHAGGHQLRVPLRHAVLPGCAGSRRADALGPARQRHTGSSIRRWCAPSLLTPNCSGIFVLPTSLTRALRRCRRRLWARPVLERTIQLLHSRLQRARGPAAAGLLVRPLRAGCGQHLVARTAAVLRLPGGDGGGSG